MVSSLSAVAAASNTENGFWQSVLNYLQNFAAGGGLVIVRTIAFAVLGLVILKIMQSVARRIALRSKLDNAAATFVISIITVVLYIALTIVIVSSLGLSTAGIIAAFSAIALAIALALQNTLASLANGMIIIFTKPFKKGDYIDLGGTEGTVQAIKLFNTKILTTNNEEIIIPNSDILSKVMTNKTAMPLRRVQIKFYISYSADADKVRNEILDKFGKNKDILKSPAPSVIFDSYGEYSICYAANAWAPNKNYYSVKGIAHKIIYDVINDNLAEPSVRNLNVSLTGEKSERKGGKKYE